MQKYTLLLKKITGTTSSESSQLEFVDNYYLYRQNNGSGIVDEFNVLTYLDDPDNFIISRNFFSYLTGNTNTAQFKEIFYDNKKLSNIFNKYYNTSVVTNVGTSTAEINLELTGTTAVTAYNYYGNWDGKITPHILMTGTPMSIEGESDLLISQNKLISTTSEDSYYIPVNINLEQELIGKINFSEYAQDFILNNKTITQGFVDVNFKTDSSEIWKNTFKPPERTTIPSSLGLNVSLYLDSFVKMADFTKISPSYRAVTTKIGPAPTLGVSTFNSTNTNYALRFTGYFYVNTEDVFTFYLTSDDGSLMYIGDILLIRNEGLHGSRQKRTTIGLQKGFHKIDVQYFQRLGGQTLTLEYSRTGVSKTIIPSSLFYK